MFFFYASSWLAEHAADWLIVQGGYYIAAIAMRSSPIILFRRDHQESPHPSFLFFHPSPSIPPLPFPCCPFFLPSLRTHVHTSGVNRAPPALSEQMGAAEDSRLVSLIPHTLHSLLSWFLSLHLGQFESKENNLIPHSFVFVDNSDFECIAWMSTRCCNGGGGGLKQVNKQ